MEQSRKMIQTAYRALEEKKGEDIRILDISRISVIADYFVIVSGSSSNQIDALVEHVEEKMHQEGFSLRQREGYRQGGWVLLDFGDIIVHVFDRESRSFYNLEHIWSDAGEVQL